MIINLDNMRMAGERLDTITNAKISDVGLSIDDITTMAYQIQYFFEAKEKLAKLAGNSNVDADTVYKAIDLFDKAIIDKESA